MAKVLLVEDDTNLSEIYQARLEAEGYVVVAASDGETALALAAKEKPDLILSDVMMPKISGFEMLDILRNTEGFKHTKVIMLTALGQAEDKTRAEALGADRYLVKSQVTLEDIVTAAYELLNSTDTLPGLSAAVPSSPAPQATVTAMTSMPVADAPTTPPVVPMIPVAPTGPLEPTISAIPTPATPILEPVGLTQPVEPLVAALQPQLVPQAVQPLPEPEPEPLPVAAQPAIIVSELPASAPAPEPAPALEVQSTATPLAQPQPVTSQDATTTVDASYPSVIDESVVANAIDKLLAKTPSGDLPADTSSALSTPSDTAVPAPPEKFHKKIISPPPRDPAPTLQELLAKEELKSSVGLSPAGAAPIAPTPAMPTSTYTSAAANPGVDPDVQALADAQAQKQASQSFGTGGSTTFDPNSVAL